MKLSDILSQKNNIVHDGFFSSLGTLFSHYPDQIVYAVRESDVIKITGNKSISSVITTPSLVSMMPDTIGIVSVPYPQHAFYALQSALYQNPDFVLKPFINQISPSAKIHSSAVIHSTSVSIGSDVVIEKNVIINEHTIIDEGAIIRANSTIGNIPIPHGETKQFKTIHPSGGVHIHRDVDIHANTCIDRAIFKGFTEIGEQTKIDNLNLIRSGAILGKKCLICGGVSIGESVIIGDGAWIGPNAILENQIWIGDNVYITIGSFVTQDIGNDKVVKDNYALDRKRFKKVIRGM